MKGGSGDSINNKYRTSLFVYGQVSNKNELKFVMEFMTLE